MFEVGIQEVLIVMMALPVLVSCLFATALQGSLWFGSVSRAVSVGRSRGAADAPPKVHVERVPQTCSSYGKTRKLDGSE